MACIEQTGIENATPKVEATSEKAIVHNPKEEVPPPDHGTKIVPKAKGTDICGQRSYQYIIRSDLGCYMKAYHLRDGDDPVTIHALHPTCTWGDHYMATPKHFYIIYVNNGAWTCRKVADLSMGKDPTTFELHKQCENGMFYMAKDQQHFYIIKEKNYLEVNNVGEGPPDDETQLDTDFMVGDYYWATTGYFYFLKPQSKWGLEYIRIKHTELRSKAKKPEEDPKAETRGTSTKLEEDTEKTEQKPDQSNQTMEKLGCNFPVYSPITAFLPGGWAVILGPTFYRWKLIKSIQNQSSAVTLKFTENITLRSGYSQKMLDLVQHNWHIPEQHAADLTIEKVFTATLKHQFILDESYGGCKLDTYQEDWTKEREVKYEIVVNIEAGKGVHFWQFVLGIGERERSQDVLFTQHVIMTETASQPTQMPLQKANTEKEKQADKKTPTSEAKESA